MNQESEDLWNSEKIANLVDDLCNDSSGTDSMVTVLGEDLTHTLYAQLIASVQFRVNQYSEHLEKVKKHHENMLQQYSNASRSKKEHVKFLQGALEEHTNNISKYIEDIQKSQMAQQLEREQWSQKISITQKEGLETITKLEKDNKKLAHELEQYEDFQSKREMLINNYKKLERRFAHIKADHEKKMRKLADKDYIDRNRLKTNSVHRVNHMANEFRNYARNTIPETTKRTLLENITRETQITNMNSSIDEIQEENAQLQTSLQQLNSDEHRISNSIDSFAQKDYAIDKLTILLDNRVKELTDSIKKLECEKNERENIKSSTQNLQFDCKKLEKQIFFWERKMCWAKKSRQSLNRKLKRCVTKVENGWHAFAKTSQPIQKLLQDEPKEILAEASYNHEEEKDEKLKQICINLDEIVSSLLTYSPKFLNATETIEHSSARSSSDSESSVSSLDSEYLENTYLKQPMSLILKEAMEPVEKSLNEYNEIKNEIESLSEIEISEPNSDIEEKYDQDDEEREVTVSDVDSNTRSSVIPLSSLSENVEDIRQEELLNPNRKVRLNQYQIHLPEWQSTLALLAEMRPPEIGENCSFNTEIMKKTAIETLTDGYLPAGFLNLVPMEKTEIPSVICHLNELRDKQIENLHQNDSKSTLERSLLQKDVAAQTLSTAKAVFISENQKLEKYV